MLTKCKILTCHFVHFFKHYHHKQHLVQVKRLILLERDSNCAVAGSHSQGVARRICLIFPFLYHFQILVSSQNPLSSVPTQTGDPCLYYGQLLNFHQGYPACPELQAPLLPHPTFPCGQILHILLLSYPPHYISTILSHIHLQSQATYIQGTDPAHQPNFYQNLFYPVISNLQAQPVLHIPASAPAFSVHIRHRIIQ